MFITVSRLFMVSYESSNDVLVCKIWYYYGIYHRRRLIAIFAAFREIIRQPAVEQRSILSSNRASIWEKSLRLALKRL